MFDPLPPEPARTQFLHGAVIRSTMAHARIQKAGFAPGFETRGLVAVGWRDVPGDNVISRGLDDQPALAQREVRHHGEPILLVAAESPTRLEEARDNAIINYVARAHVTDIDASVTRSVVLHGKDNVFHEIESLSGDPDAVMDRAPHVVQEIYRSGLQAPVPLRTLVVESWPVRRGFVIRGPFASTDAVADAGARVLERGVKIEVRSTVEGFGIERDDGLALTSAIHVLLLAHAARRPVRLAFDSREQLVAASKSYPADILFRTGVEDDGRIIAADIDIVLDGGAYAGAGPGTLSRGIRHVLSAYTVDDVRVRAKIVATNNPPNAPLAGFDAPFAVFAAERHIESIAKQLKLCDRSVRARNIAVSGDAAPFGRVVLESADADDVMRAAMNASNFESKRTSYAIPQSGWRRRGIGCGLHRFDADRGSAFTAQIVEVEVDMVTFEVEIIGAVIAVHVGEAERNDPGLVSRLVATGSMALGAACFESVSLVDGRMTNARLRDYLVPTSRDLPRIQILPVPIADGGRLGHTAVRCDGIVAATANAVAQATRLEVTEAPLLPESLAEVFLTQATRMGAGR